MKNKRKDDAEVRNMIFMVVGDSNQVRSFNYHIFNILQSNLDMIADKLQKGY